MASPAARTPPKRLRILDDEEIAALYERPCFTADERTQYFALTQPEHDLVASFERVPVQLYCMLQLAYFKAKQLFFTFAMHDVVDDVTHLLDRYFPTVQRPSLRPLNKRTILKQRHAILEYFQYRRCSAVERQQLTVRAQQAARISSKPIYVLREVLHYLTEQRMVSPGYTVLQADIVGKALTAEQTRLTDLLRAALSSAERAVLDGLFAPSDGLYAITRLKHEPKDFSFGEMRREIARADQLLPLYHLATRIVPRLGISNEGITYYASLVTYYSVFRLQQLDPALVALYLLCFVFHRYQRLNDNLLACFIHLVTQYADEAKAAAKEQVYVQRNLRNQDLPKAGRVLKLFLDDQAPETPFATVQATAFAILARDRLADIADYIATEASFDETAFQWQHIDTIARRFKQHLRPILRTVDLTATRLTAPILEAVQFLKEMFASARSLRQSDPTDLPSRCIPMRDKPYLYARATAAGKAFIPDRYEFLVYRLLRNGLEAGDIFCRTSVRFRSFEDDLLSDGEWKHKDTLLAETGLASLTQPIRDHLAALECALEERIFTVNARIAAGENTAFELKRQGRRTHWTLQYPAGSEGINHPVFESLRQVSIGSLLHFVNQHCAFMACFEPVVGRYSKQAVDERSIRAGVVAWGTNMGLGRMADISDIGFDRLRGTSENVLRPETLTAANDCVSNAIAAMPIFRHYDLDGVVHSRSDGQKFETALPTFNARHSPKYFGLHKGVVAYTLIANHVPINARIIGAHEHESQFVFDLLVNNTTEIQPVVHSTDTHGTNQVNFALLHLFGYQFAPRYRDIQDRMRTSLYGFRHPRQYGGVLLKPIRKLNTELIVEEWDNLQRIFVSLALKTTTQSIIVGKLNAYARKNKTRQALWEFDNIVQSLYLLDFVDSPPLRKNVQQALNRGENYHQLRRAVSYANFGKLRFRNEDDQQLWHECSRLITNCIIFYNTTMLSRALAYKEATGDTAGATLLMQVSPVAWQHINFYGRYEFTTGPDPIDMDAMVEALTQSPMMSVEDAE
jgi:TnpA family transposase